MSGAADTSEVLVEVLGKGRWVLKAIRVFRPRTGCLKTNSVDDAPKLSRQAQLKSSFTSRCHDSQWTFPNNRAGILQDQLKLYGRNNWGM